MLARSGGRPPAAGAVNLACRWRVYRARTEAIGGIELIDEATIRLFLHGLYPRLVAALGMLAGSRPLAEDAVQEALARAWERSECGEEIRNLDAWVTAVAVNLSRSALRRMRAERRARERVTRAAIDEPSPAAVDVWRAVSALPRRQRESVVLHYYLGLDVRDVAAALGVHEGTVKTSLHRARGALAVALGERIDEEATDRD